MKNYRPSRFEKNLQPIVIGSMMIGVFICICCVFVVVVFVFFFFLFFFLPEIITISWKYFYAL